MGVVLATWNVHGWVGRDRARDPRRCFEVIRQLEADVVALQEAEGLDWQQLAEAAGFRALFRPAGSRPFGNALLVRNPLVSIRDIDLSVRGLEERAALDAIVALPAGSMRILATHLGLRRRERRQQAARLARHIEERAETMPVALLGDLNDWTPWGSQLRPLVRAVGPLSRISTFPSQRPLLPLDRAAWRAPGTTSRLAAVRAASVRIASDHLPLRLELGKA